MIDEYLIKQETDHLIRLLYGQYVDVNNTKDIRNRLYEDFGISVNVSSEGSWLGEKNYTVQVIRKNKDGKYIEEHCTGMYGDNGEFHSRSSAVCYGMLIACTFAFGIRLKQGYLCLDD